MPKVLGSRGRSTMSPSVPSSARRYARLSKRLAIGLVGALPLLTLLLTACGPDNGSGPTYAKQQTFIWPYYGTANLQRDEVLDPATVTAAEDLGTLNMIYAGLVTLSPSTLTVQPDAATWGVDATGTVYTFHLKPNLHFSDGTPLTASDYAYSIDRALDAPDLCTVDDAKTYGATGACAPVSSTYLSMILGAADRLSGANTTVIGTGDDPNHGVDVLDPDTLRIRLAKPTPYFLEALTYPTSFPVERALVQKYPDGLWVDHLDQGGCSGPFKIVSYGGGKQLKLVPNPSWEAAYRPLTLTEVDRPAIASEDDEYARYRTGQFDYTDIPAEDYSLASSQDDFHEVPTLQTRYFGLNQDKPPFDNVLVRRAFDLALNKQLLVDRLFNGGAIPTNHILPLGMPGFNAALVNPPPDDTQALTGNQAAAKQLLQQALQQCSGTMTPAPDFCPFIDHQDRSQEIDIVYNSNRATDHDVTTAAASSWVQVLNLNVKAVPSNLSDNDYFGNLTISPTHPICPYQAWSVAWIADYPDPQDWTSLQFSHTLRSPFNAVDEHSTALDTLMQAADHDLNPTDRMAKYQQIEQDLVNDVAWLPYAQGKVFWRLRSWVHGFSLDAQTTMTDLTWPSVYITQR